MDGHRNRNFIDYLKSSDRIELAEYFMRPVPDLTQIAEGVWGQDGVGAEVTGTHDQMRTVVNHKHKQQERAVRKQLPIWC